MQNLTRRNFLRLSAASTGMLALGGFHIGRAGTPANSKLNVAVIGVTGQGGTNIQDIAGNPRVNLTAICDVDRHLLGLAGMKWNEQSTDFVVPDHTQKFIDSREMLDVMGDRIDAVLVCTPDHAHMHQAINAMAAGKHLFCEKPLSNTIWATRQIHAAAGQFGVVTQMGIHNHMSEPLRLYKEWYDAGLLGPVREVHAWTDRPWWPYGMNDYAAPLPVPETLDWESWINTAEFRAYGEGYHPTLWRSWWEFGSGTIGDMGCHLLDLPFYMFNLGQPGRVEVVEIANGTEIAIPSGAHIVFHFPAGTNHGPLAVHWYEGFRMVDGKKQMFRPALPGAVPPDTKLSPNGRLIVCEKGVMYSDHVRFNTPIIFPEGEFDRWRNENLLPPKTLPRGRGNIRAEWVDAIFNGRPELASAGFDYSAPLTEATLVGNLAIRSGKSLGWDPAAMRATDNDPANTFIKPAFRSGWVTDRFQFV